MNLINLIVEAKTSVAKGSEAGREKMKASSKKSHTKSAKSRVKVYDSITDALRKGYPGQIFSTKDADRLYVITKQKWGTDPEQIISGRSAKGFSDATPFERVKKYAVRTLLRHGKQKSKKFKSKKYWSRKQKD